MRRVKDVIQNYDPTEKGDEKKIILIEWFQKHPGQRFDRNEVYREVGDELEIGEKQIGNYLNKLKDDNILKSYGSKRISYELEDDILIPVKYQTRTAFKHIVAIFDVKRWGIAGFAVNFTVIWGILTVPFWLFWILLIITPMERIGPLSQSDMFSMMFAMTFWLMISAFAGVVLYRIHLSRS